MGAKNKKAPKRRVFTNYVAEAVSALSLYISMNLSQLDKYSTIESTVEQLTIYP